MHSLPASMQRLFESVESGFLTTYPSINYYANMRVLTLIFRELSKLLLKPASLLILLVLVGLAGGYFYNENRISSKRLSELSGDQQLALNEEIIQELVTKVSEIVELPQGERPVIANVTDLKGLSDQEFYKDAQVGDRVLIYPIIGKAYLYRPSTHKIINISPVTLNQEDQNVAGPVNELSDEIPQEVLDDITEQAENIRIVFYNGTSVAGITTQAFDDIVAALPEIKFEVESRGDASNDYVETRVVNLANFNFDTVQNIATALGGSVGNLPEGEEEPDADILVIVGSNYTQE